MDKTSPELVHQLTPAALASSQPWDSCALGTGQSGARRSGLAHRPPQGTAAMSRGGLQLYSSPPAPGAVATCVPGQLGPARSPGNTGLHCWLHQYTDSRCFVAKKVMLKDRLAFENGAHPLKISSPHVARSSRFGNNLRCQREKPFPASHISSPQKNPGQMWPPPITSLLR